MTCIRRLTQIILSVFCLFSSAYCSPSSETLEYLPSTITGYSEQDSTSETWENTVNPVAVSSSTAFWGGEENNCACTDIDLHLKSLTQSASNQTSLEFVLNVEQSEGNNACHDIGLTKVFIERYGPIDGISPARNSTCSSSEINCSAIPQFETICIVNCVFNPESAWVPCGNYTLDITPQYFGCENATSELRQLTSVIAPSTGEDIVLMITNVNARSDSFTVRWSVSPLECYSIITSYNMILHYKVGNKPPQRAPIPHYCTERERNEIIFRSNTCPGLFSISPCSDYSVEVAAEINRYETPFSEAASFTTLPPGELEINVYDVSAGSRWISFVWNLSQPECVSTLTRIMLRATDTYDNQTFSFGLPKNCSQQSDILDTENCFVNITSPLPGTEQDVLPCTLYEIHIFPQISEVDYTEFNTSFNTKTCPDDYTVLAVYGVRSGAEWVSFYWSLSDPRCENALTGLNLRVTDVGQNKKDILDVDIPRNCSGCNFSSSNHNCSLNITKNIEGCPSVPILPCSHYQINLYPDIWDIPYAQFSGSNSAKTTPRNDLAMSIYNVQSGAEWISFNWNLSEPHCENALTGLKLEVTDVGQNNRDTLDFDIPRKCSGCNFSSSNHNCSLNITKNIEGCPPVPILSCSHYQISLYPKIWNVLYEQFNGSNSAKTTPDRELKLNTYNISSGSEWISFRWNLSNPRCMVALTGSRLNITDENLISDAKNLTKYCSGCGNELNPRDCLMNTTTNKGCPLFHLEPCVDYKVRLDPQIWDESYELWDNFIDSSTSADENLHAVIDEKSLSSGSSWISFKWQVSTETCRSKIASYLVSKIIQNHQNPGYSSFSCETQLNETEQFFNTSMKCFNETMHSCTDYSLSLILQLQGKVVGKPTLIKRTTLFDNLIRTNINPNSSHGVNWFSFKWSLSDRGCNNYISSYSLNVTEFFNETQQTRSLNLPYCVEVANEHSFIFNSSCPTANLSIVPCTRYMVTVSPSLSINNNAYKLGPSLVSKLETSSGDWGELENPIVSSREAKAITLEWSEPKCRYNGGIKNYNITLTSAWNKSFGEAEKFELTIIPECLERLSDWRASVTLNETMCNNQSVKFISCSPYKFTVLPEFVVTSANENVQGWSENTATVPLHEDLGVDLAVKDQGSRWFLLSWNELNCRSAVTRWTLQDNTMSISIPPYCPLLENIFGNQTKLLLNITDTLTCQNVPGLPISPCTSHNFTLRVELDMIDGVLSTENGTTSGSSLSEDPGSVTEVQWNSTAKKVYINWSPPRENPQCVQGYQVEWEGKTKKVDQTSIIIDNLEACSNYSVAITALSAAKPLLNKNEIEVSTQFIEPEPVINPSFRFVFSNQSMGLLKWDKPNDDVDDCVTDYQVKIRELDSENLMYSKLLSGKNSTEIYLFEEDFQRRKNYMAYITSLCSLSGHSSESASKPFSWSSSDEMRNVAAMIVPPIICVVCFLLLIGLVLIIRKRRDQKETDGYNSAEFPINRKSIHVEDFDRMLAFLDADSSYELSKEYEEVKKISATHACEAAKKEENREKNRYLDILPYDHSRVKLRAVHLDGSERSDYINASFVTGFGRIPGYIAAQGPKPSTIQDFWRMCLEQEVRVIVALTAMEERGKIKCAQYWPSEGALEYGYIRVELTSSIQRAFFTQRKFSVAQGERIGARIITQLHFSIWPDFGCPDSPESLVELVHAMRKENSASISTNNVPTPIVIHCSAGVGRTGTLIALDLLMKQASQQRVVDVFGTTIKIRQDRGKMVQNEDQYRFLYRCLGHYIGRELFKQP